MKPAMKERLRKQNFLKNVGLLPRKNLNATTIDQENNICERVCFYYFDNDEQVICRGCYKSFKTWLDFRKHFNNISCHITETNYKLNTYNDIYRKYKSRKTKTNKRIKDRLNAAQLMDFETLNTRKTRKRCYINTRAVVNNISKSSSDSGSSNSEKTEVKTKNENYVSIDNSLESIKQKINTTNIIKIQDIPNSTKSSIPKIEHDSQFMSSIKTECNADDILSLVSSDDQSSNSAHCISKFKHKENKAEKYICVICDKQFSSKCLLTMHQVQHIKSDRSSYGVFMAALTTRSG